MSEQANTVQVQHVQAMPTEKWAALNQAGRERARCEAMQAMDTVLAEHGQQRTTTDADVHVRTIPAPKLADTVWIATGCSAERLAAS